MTRINIVPVEELTDKHLLAEYRELPRISKLARLPKNNEKFPVEYCLGKGHVKFFYDKGKFLKSRFRNLVSEMKRRGFRPKYTEYREHPAGLNLDYVPTEDALEANRQRIRERLAKVNG